MTNKKFIDNIAYAFIEWKAICVDFYPEYDWREHLLLSDDEIHRGVHESVRNAKKLIPIFYWGLGWVDISYELWLEIIDKFNLDKSKLRTNNLRLNDRKIKRRE